MKPQLITINAVDIAILLKICSLNSAEWYQSQLAEDLFLSQAQISKSISRLKYARLIYPDGKKVVKHGFLELLEHAIAYFFPQHPGAIIRGIPTAHSAPPLNEIIISEEHYVWPSGTGSAKGQAIIPLYPNVVKLAKYDRKMYELLSLTDALRVGKAREKELAFKELKKRIIGEE